MQGVSAKIQRYTTLREATEVDDMLLLLLPTLKIVNKLVYDVIRSVVSSERSAIH